MPRSIARRLIPMLLLAAGCRGQAVTKAPQTGPAPAAASAVVLISLDAFRWDYLSRPNAVNLRRLAATGVHAERMVPSFPSLTFPNHYTMVTGLYPAHHGIVDNTMFDPALGWFKLNDTLAQHTAAWWGGEPVWITAERQGRHAGAFFWPGSEVAHGGVRPSRWMPFDDKFPNAARIDSVLTWLTLPAPQTMSLVALYYSDVDHAGHTYGPATPEVDSAIARVDSMVGRLLDGIAARHLDQRVNVIVVADHGMTWTSPDRIFFLDDYISLDDVDVIDANEIGLIAPKPGKLDEVYRKLHGANPHVGVYRKGQVPARFHYDSNAHITPIILIPDLGWLLSTHARFAQRRPNPGAHGFDNQAPDMGALFVAAGPAFRRGITVPPFQNIHVYDLICHILGIKPAPNDGSLDSTRVMLRP